jgi:membrane-bound serine protease (ClpP class)
LAAPVAAMAPATNLGAAHPVGAGGKDIQGAMADKAVADLSAMIASLAKRRGRPVEPATKMVAESASYDSGRARELGLVDLVAPELGALLTALQGKAVETAAGRRSIRTEGKAITFHRPGLRHQLLSLLANPNLAYILLMIGLMGLYFELSHPGTILPGVVGGLSLILALFAMSTLPVSWTGLALIGMAVVLFVAEIYVASGGLLALAGAASLVLGSVMLFETEQSLVELSLWVMVPTVAGVTAFFGAVTWLAMRAQISRATTGAEGLVGMAAVAVDAGRVRVMGELWRARAPRPLEPGEKVRITAVDGLELAVEPQAGPAPQDEGG